MLAAVIFVSSATNRAGLNPSNPPWKGTTNFLVAKLTVDPAGVIETVAPFAKEADGCCFSLLKLNATFCPESEFFCFCLDFFDQL